MSDRIIAATRKGLFFFDRAAQGWVLSDDSFLGSPMTYVLSDPRDGALYAAANLGHFGPKLHRSDDEGRSWVEIGMPAFPKAEGDDSKDGPSVVQIWSLAAKGMRAAYMPPDMAYDGVSQDPHLMVQCPSAPDTYWIQHHNGIFRSTSNLESWNEIVPENCPAFGFAVAVHPRDPDTAWFVPAVKDEYRYPKDGKFIVSRTRDGGGSFDLLDNGLPQQASYDLVYRHGLDVDASGERLVMGSTTGGAWVSENGGDGWAPLPARLPPVYAINFI